MFLNCPNLRVLIRISLGLFVLGYSLFLHGQTATVRWGTHEGISSPLWEADWGTGPGYTDGNPTAVQTLQDLSGNLVNSSGGPGTGSSPTWSKGDLVELGFFASALGSDNAAGGTSGDADTPSTNLFQGTWIPLTGLTHIGQDWGTRTSFDGSAFEMKQTVDAGEFAFSSAFTQTGGNWQSYVRHNDDADSTYEIIATSGGNSDQPSNLADSSAILTTSTKLGIRFYDAASVSNGATKYNTVMNTNWTWPGLAATEEMYLHDISNPDNLDSNLKFEFDNTSYGDGNSDFTAKVDGSSVSDHGTAGDLNTDDFVTTITYWTGLSALDISANNKDTVLSGVTGSSTITGGSDNILTMNVNGVGVSTNAYSFDGDIVDNGANNGGIRVVKTGAGSQTLTGNLALDDDTDSYLSVYEGILALDTASGKTHTVEYLTGESGATLELKDGDSDLITLGFAHTTSAKDFEGTLLLSDNIAHTVKVSTGTAAADYGKEQILSGSLSTTGTDTLVKDGVGKLRLTGDSSSNYDNALTVNHGTLIIGDGSDGGAALHSSTTVTLETGKLEIAASENISNTIAGSTTSSKKSMVGGKGTLSTGGAGVAIGSGSGEIDVISPGHGVSSSLTNTTSQVQASVGNGSDSIGTFTVTNLNLNDGGVYDWEISNFAGSAGSGWDVLAYSDLDFEGNQAFDINIFSLASDGSAGANSGDTFAAKSGTSGFKFLDGGSHGAIDWGSFTNPGTGGGTLASGYFDINQQGWSHYNHHYGSWGVYYDGAGDFYLEYSAVPEPSTYIMVTSLLMVPGYNFVRRYRKKKSAEENEIPENLS
jgi:autotransporter-associated beta strand protein